MDVLVTFKPLSHGPKNLGHARVDPRYSRTLLPSQGRIRVKNGGQGSYAVDDEGVASGRFGRCTFSGEESFYLTALITWLKRSAPLWPTASPDSFV